MAVQHVLQRELAPHAVAGRFAEHFQAGEQTVPIVEVAGRTYPVETRYRVTDAGEADSA